MVARFLLLLLATVLVLQGCADSRSALERVQRRGELVVATRNAATTWYEGPHGLSGMEYDLVTLFAERLGVKVRFTLPKNLDLMLRRVEEGDVDLAAAGLTVTKERAHRVHFGPAYHEITQQLVYRLGSTRPKSIEDVVGGVLEVVADSSHEEELRRRKESVPELEWVAREKLSTEELLYLVQESVIDYTVADSTEVAINRRYYPRLAVAFDLTEPQPLAWVFPKSEDSSLYQEAVAFFEEIDQSGQLAQLVERHFGHVYRLKFVDFRTFQHHIAQRLPKLRPLFEAAADDCGLDWKLLAAMGYQESHWDPQAVSPTGVKGLMMLTRATSRQMGVNDRTDAQESIFGGARYLVRVRNKVPKRIQDPDRMWLGLAAYNIGYGHLEDARVLTQRQGSDPDKWAEVKQRLPLLAKEQWYSTVKHGYARGREAVTYVDNIRNYYEMLDQLVDAPAPNAPSAPRLNISGQAL
jgi:membrane-bound lytic murein transglycosylase F